jgi:hypothetical protein
MSTSTGPAYKLKEATDLFTISEQLDLVREKQNLAVTQEFFDLAVHSYDHTDGKISFAEFLKEKRNEIYDNLKKDNNTHYSLARLLEPEIFLYHNSVRNEIYARLINFDEAATTEFAKLPFIDKDMSYYNGSDSQLSEMSEEEWYDRRDAWDELGLLGKKYPTILKLDVTDVLTVKYNQISPKAVREHWDELNKPSVNARCTRKFSTVYFAYLQDKESKELSFDQVMEILRYRYDDEVELLYNYDKHKKAIPKLREKTEKFVQDNPIEL